MSQTRTAEASETYTGVHLCNYDCNRRNDAHIRSDAFRQFVTPDTKSIIMKIKNLHVYQLEHVEIAWNNLVRCEEYRSKLATTYALEHDLKQRQAHLAMLLKLEEFYVAAVDASRSMGSQGNFLVTPHVGFIPTGLCMSAYLIWTDDDHGSMYVVSPVEMPHLEV